MPLTPSRLLGHDIEARAIEAQLIRRLVELADDVADGLSNPDERLRERRREELAAVLRGASAMIGDLVEDLGKLQDRAYALQEPPSGSRAPSTPAAA